MSDQEPESSYPPNARIAALRFEPGMLVVELPDQGERRVSPDQVVGLFGAGIVRQSTQVVTEKKKRNPLAGMAMAAAGVPPILPGKTVTRSVDSQEVHHALALRVRGVPETWYLLASSFNFRKPLGPDAGYSAALNLKAFVRRLAEHCPEAPRDRYFEAALGQAGEPQPVDSLLTFLRTVAAAPGED